MSAASETPKYARGAWSEDEHQRFLDAMTMFPKGPWKAIAEFIGSRSVRQTQTHAQQRHEKMARQLLVLRREKGKRSVNNHNSTADAQTPLELNDIVSRWRALDAQRETDGILMSPSPQSSSRTSSPPRSARSSTQSSPVHQPSTATITQSTELEYLHEER